MNALSPITQIWIIGTADVDDYWDRVEPLLQKAVARGNPRVTIDGTYRRLKDGHCYLFVAWVNQEIKAAVTAFFGEYDTGRWLTINLCGGYDMHQWLPQGNWFLEEFAKSNGCVGMETVGRPGWARTLGMHQRSAICERIF